MGRLGYLDAPRTGHVPVLLQEVVKGLAVRPGGRYLDATVGGGGHAAAILEASAPTGTLLGLDRDPEAVARASARLASYGDRVRIIHASYGDLLSVAREEGVVPLDGVLFDLGFSSCQIQDAQRGFAFQADGPLDMRFDPGSEVPTAADLVNESSLDALVDLLRRYGEEPRAVAIARAIVQARPISSTRQLAEVIAQAVGGRSGRVHPATRTFQALRIAVNRELETLEDALPQALMALKSGGRLAVISFHSLEDRIVKHFFHQEASDCICPPEQPVCQCNHRKTVRLVMRKPIVPSPAEVQANPRSRSAKLRIVERL